MYNVFVLCAETLEIKESNKTRKDIVDVLVVADGHYYQTPDGSVYTDSIYDYKFYRRYLQSFERIYAAVRVQKVNEAPIGKKLSSGVGVSFLPLPAYRGPFEYIQKYFQINSIVKKYCREYECAIFRIPAATSNVFCKYFSKTGKPFAVEVVIDPWENFGPKTAGNPVVIWIVRRVWTKLVRKMCQKAVGASYVTERYLQKHYPPKAFNDKTGMYFTEYYSSVELPDDSFAIPRKWNHEQKKYCISHVSNLFTGYGKGHLVLMDAVKIVREWGYDVSICFVGDGPKKEEFRQYANKIGIGVAVFFAGKQSGGEEVRKVIHATDIFVLPSRAEGLPRALLEAMAEGLPCLSSPVCGIPEVLEKEFLFDYNDAKGFAEGIQRFINNPDMMTDEGKRNIYVAKKYKSSLLNEKRKSFYDRLRYTVEKLK